MAKITQINLGTAPNDGTGDPLRTALGKCNNAIATVETDATLTGDGNLGSVLSVDKAQLGLTAADVGLGNVDNVSAADLRDRSTHTGTQTLSTISDAGTIASQDATNVTITGGAISGSTLKLKMTSAADPAVDAAVTQAIIDANDGTVITLTAAGNSQTLASPTDTTAGKQFVVINDSTSTSNIDINGVTVKPDSILRLTWDGTEWVCNTVADSVQLDDTNLSVINTTNLQTYIEQNDLALLNARSTGARTGGRLTDQGLGVARISAGSGQIIDNTVGGSPVYSPVDWIQTDVDLSAADGVYFVYVNSTGTILTQTTEPTRDEWRTKIFLQRVSVIGGLISGFVSITAPIQQDTVQVGDVFSALGRIKSGQGLAAGGANLTLNIAKGSFFGQGLGYNDSYVLPNEAPIAVASPATFRYVTQDGTQGSDVTNVDPANYDVTNTITAIPGSNSRATLQAVWRFPNGNTRIFYGQTFYGSLTEAVGSVEEYDSQIVVPETYRTGGMLLGYIAVTKTATNLQDDTQAIFISTNNFGFLGGGLISSGSGVSGPTTSTDNGLAVFDGTTGRAIKNNTGVTVDQSGNAAGFGNLNMTGNLTVGGDLTVNGTTTTLNTQTVLAEDNTITVNSGETGAGVTAGSAGIVVDRGTATDYQFIFDESDDSFKVGEVGSLQAVATREDVPTDNGLATWDAASSSFVTNTGASYDGTTLSIGDGQFFGWGDNTTRIEGNSTTDTISLLTSGGVERVRTEAAATTIRNALSLPDAAVAPTGIGAYNDGGTRFTIRSGTNGFRVNNSANSVTNFDVDDSGNGILAGTLTSEALSVNGTNPSFYLGSFGGVGRDSRLTSSSNSIYNFVASNALGNAVSFGVDTGATPDIVFGNRTGAIVTRISEAGSLTTTTLTALDGSDGVQIGRDAGGTAASYMAMGAGGTIAVGMHYERNTGVWTLGYGTNYNEVDTNPVMVGSTVTQDVSFSGQNLTLTGGSNAGFRLDNGTVQGVMYNTGDNSLTVGTVSNHPLVFFTNNATAGSFSTSGDFTSVGSISSGGNFTNIGTGKSTETVEVSIAPARSGDGTSLIDLIGDTTYTDYGMRIIRNAGANNVSAIEHRGTGTLSLTAVDAGSVNINTNGATRLLADSSGDVGIGTTSLDARLHVSRSGGSGNDFILSNENANGEIFNMRAKLTADTFYHNANLSVVRESDGAGAFTISTGVGGTASERVRVRSNGIVNFTNAPTYADDTAAGAGGLVAGDVYKTATGELRIKL